jgi:hypothetical protein
MGWSKTATVGDTVIEMRFSRSGQFHRRLDAGDLPEEKARLSGRHMRLVLRRRRWEDMSEEERAARLESRP